MLRTIQEELVRWQESSNHRPLLFRGARQVGKTYAIRQFAETCFENCIELNFELQPQLTSIFSSLDPSDILKTLSLTQNVTLTPGRTLLFLDEIQECPQAIRALRYFYEQLPALHVIGVGSLLDVTLR